MSRQTEGVLISIVAQRNPEDILLTKANTAGGKIAQKWRALAAPGDDEYPQVSSQMSGGSNTGFWPLRALQHVMYLYTCKPNTHTHKKKKETNTVWLCSYGVWRIVKSIRREANGGCQRLKGRGNGDLPMDLRIPASQNESLWTPIANLKPGLSHQQPMSCMNSRMAINMAWHKYHTLMYSTMRFSFIFNDVFGMWLYGSWVWTLWLTKLHSTITRS